MNDERQVPAVLAPEVTFIPDGGNVRIQRRVLHGADMVTWLFAGWASTIVGWRTSGKRH